MGDYLQKLNALYENDISKPGLIRIVELLKRLGNPQNEIKCVHIAGTNGKGSTCAYIEAAMRYAGYKTAMFTSPHLYDIREYIKIDNQLISEDKIEKYAETSFDVCEKMVADGFEHPTFFEMITAIAFDFFSDSDIDIAVIEAGLGGEGDATNVIYPILSVITHISLDHTDVLGGTVAKIAQEKAGIIKSGIPVIIAPNQKSAVQSVIKSKCKKTNSLLVDAEKYKIQIYEMSLSHISFSAKYESELYRFRLKNIGRHQAENAVTALCALNAISASGYDIDYSAIKKGLNTSSADSRIQVFEKEKIIIDVSHNIEGVRELGEAVKELLPNRKIVLICSVIKTKDAESMATQYKQFVDFAFLTKAAHPKAFEARELSRVFKSLSIECESYEIIDQAVEAALKKCREVDAYLVVSGSFYMISDVKSALKLI